MKVGVLILDLQVPGAGSLKDKRRVVKSLKERLRNRFNCSVAEIGYQDIWQRAQLGISVISDDSRHASEQLNEIARYAANDHQALMLDYRIEML